MNRAKITRTPIGKKINRTPVGGVERTPVNGPLLLIKKDPRDDMAKYQESLKESRARADKTFLKKISREVGYVESLTETNLEPTRLYHYQQDWINDRSKYRHCDKSRQIGQSYGFSCEGFAKSQLLNIYTGIFISYNQDEANEKITYARALHESTPYKYRKKLVVDRITALEWGGRTLDGRKTKTRLISHPQREPRGKGFNTDVFLDELAHYQWQEKVYIAAVPIVTRGLGQLSLASSPLGQSGLHYEIGHNTEDYDMYSRHKIYWWDNPDFLSEDAARNMKDVAEIAPDMETEQRVSEFGNDAIVQAFKSMLIEYFQQEYELRSIDETVSYYPMDLIKQCTFEALSGFAHVEDGDTYGDNPVYEGAVYPALDLRIYPTMEELSHAISKGLLTKRFFAGFDIGRKEDNSEIIVLEELPNYNHLQIVRLIISLKNVKFRKQYELVEKLFSMVPIQRMKIDSTGIGLNLSEDLRHRFHSRIQDVNFNNENKGEMATNLKLRMEDRIIAYPNERLLLRQIHSIKRKVTEGALIKYEVAASERRMHHGDKFWALALGSSAGEPAQMYRVKLLGTSLQTVPSSQRLLSLHNDRIFKDLPSIQGVNYKSLPLPPKHMLFNVPVHKEMLN